jgi:hypothetical protein
VVKSSFSRNPVKPEHLAKYKNSCCVNLNRRFWFSVLSVWVTRSCLTVPPNTHKNDNPRRQWIYLDLLHVRSASLVLVVAGIFIFLGLQKLAPGYFRLATVFSLWVRRVHLAHRHRCISTGYALSTAWECYLKMSFPLYLIATWILLMQVPSDYRDRLPFSCGISLRGPPSLPGNNGLHEPHFLTNDYTVISFLDVMLHHN